MAQPWVTGPVDIWVGVGSGNAPLFLGHDERMLEPQIRPAFTPVHSDIAGQRIPLDMMYDGEDALVNCTLTRFNESVYATIADRSAARVGASARGRDVPGNIGTLMITEGKTFQLWLRFPYSAKAAMSGLPGGYRFVAAYLAGPDGLGGLGTTNRRTRLSFHCLRALDLTSTNSFGAGAFTLYDHAMGAVSGLSID